MSLFGMTSSRVVETCSCGARFTYTGPLSMSAAHDWRTSHRCRPRPKPAKSDPTPETEGTP